MTESVGSHWCVCVGGSKKTPMLLFPLSLWGPLIPYPKLPLLPPITKMLPWRWQSPKNTPGSALVICRAAVPFFCSLFCFNLHFWCEWESAVTALSDSRGYLIRHYLPIIGSVYPRENELHGFRTASTLVLGCTHMLISDRCCSLGTAERGDTSFTWEAVCASWLILQVPGQHGHEQSERLRKMSAAGTMPQITVFSHTHAASWHSTQSNAFLRKPAIWSDFNFSCITGLINSNFVLSFRHSY